MKHVAMVMTAVLVALATSLEADEIGYIEDFALARDRSAALQRLIPGSEEYYY